MKNFGNHLRSNTRHKIARLLNLQTKKVAARAGVPVHVVTGSMQSGQTFGERFAGAIESTFQLGFENVISIGNDCLSLTPGRLRQAIQHLQHQDFVFGPSDDGGVYLLGIKSRFFKKNTFTQLPWQTGEVLPALMKYAGQGSIALLPPATDADDEASLLVSLRLLRNFSGLKNVLENLLRTPRILFFEIKHLPPPAFACHFLLRAPPC